ASDGWVHHSDLYVYVSKIVYYDTFFSTGLRGGGHEGGGDLDAYVNALQDKFNRWRPSDRLSIARKLQAAYVWNYLDPTFFFAFYSTFVNKLYAGERYGRMPLPSVGRLTFYPSTRFNLSPFGAEHYLDLFVQPHGPSSLLADLYGRVGSSGLATYAGGGLRVL